jgi:multicomponent Na+:H+ antiporter subunit B
MRKWLIFFFIGGVTVFFFQLHGHSEMVFPRDLYTYYIEQAYAETGAKNVVGAIYLNYRIFDTLFEALMLLVSVFGVIYFSRYKGGYNQNE